MRTRRTRFYIVAYPRGTRVIVKVREEYVDVERDGTVIATVGAEGPVA